MQIQKNNIPLLSELMLHKQQGTNEEMTTDPIVQSDSGTCDKPDTQKQDDGWTLVNRHGH